MPTKTSAEPYRLQPDPPEGDRQTIERELAKRDSAEDEPTEQVSSWTPSGGSIEGASP